jgi:hypothetical protein
MGAVAARDLNRRAMMRQLVKGRPGRNKVVWLSLGALAGMVGCKLPAEEPDVAVQAALLAENGMSMNGMSMNGMSMNGMSMNGMSMNGMSMNGLSVMGLSMNGLSSTSGLMTTNGGRNIVKYMIKCALPSGHAYVGHDQNGNSYTYAGSIGTSPEWETGLCGKDCQERLSACMLAHVNNAGAHISLWLDGEGAVGWGKSTDYPYMEGAFFGNLITDQSSNNVAGGWTGYYCNGADYDQGSVPGRLGAPLTSTVYQNGYGGGVLCTQGQGGVNKCNLHSDGSGFDNCTIAPNGVSTTYNHVVTVWRNYEPGMPYKICNSANLCLTAFGSGPGAPVNGSTYAGATTQQWYVTQVSPGRYKLVNAATGYALDYVGSKAIQNTYTGAASQLDAIAPIAGQPGRFRLAPSSWTAAGFDGGLTAGAQTTVSTNVASDSAKWVLTGIVGGVSFDPSTIYHLRPLSAPNSSVDVLNASTTNGTPLQEYTSWDGDTQKFNILASGSYWKITLKVNSAKCVGPVANGTGNGTQLEVQDCNGSSNQAWSATTDGATSSAIFKNVASGRCLDVAGGITTNGTRMDLFDCNGTSSQKYQVQ